MQKKKKRCFSLLTCRCDSFWLCLFLTMEANSADIFLIYWKVKCVFATESSLSNRLKTHLLNAFSVCNHFNVHHQTRGLHVKAHMLILGPRSCFNVYLESLRTENMSDVDGNTKGPHCSRWSLHGVTLEFEHGQLLIWLTAVYMWTLTKWWFL